MVRTTRRPAAQRPASERLREENKRTEWKLHQLRAQMERESAKTGGRWKHGQAQGALRGFASQVRDAPKPSGKTDGGRRKKSNNKKVVLKGAEATSWSKEEVQCWLQSLGLERHAATFGDNEIDGTVLLELGVDDLDYMGITALGARKTLLKEVARLRRCCSCTGDARPSTPGAAAPSAAAHATPAEKVLTPRRVTIVHEEAKEEEVKGSLMEGELDEAAEHEAFRRAVEEWRNGGGSGGGSGGAERKGSSEAASSGPAPLLEGKIDEEAEHKAFVRAVDEWRRGPSTEVKIVDINAHREQAKQAREQRNERILAEFEANLRRSKPQELARQPSDSALEGWDFEACY